MCVSFYLWTPVLARIVQNTHNHTTALKSIEDRRGLPARIYD